jgi:hypothetical protein
MKTLLSTFSLLLIFSATAFADGNPIQEAVNFQKVYAPVGFDDNDNVQIVGEGMLAIATRTLKRPSTKPLRPSIFRRWLTNTMAFVCR